MAWSGTGCRFVRGFRDQDQGSLRKRTRFWSRINNMRAHEIGFGLGLRPEHYEEIAANPGRVAWFEALLPGRRE